MERWGLAPGTPIGGYTIVAPLGSGGMGAVYRAVDDGGAPVALKLLHPDVGADPVARARLGREVAALQKLRHPAVARVLDAEADSTEAFLVTELVPGDSLDVLVRRDGPLAAAELADLATGLRDALDAVHAAGVVHRDLKPSNVMCTPRGPVLIDFGLAQDAGDAPLTQLGLVAGTPGYLAPELLDGGEPTPGSDRWGLAAVVAFAGTGRPPFGSGPVPTVLARSRAGEPDVADLPARTAAALRAALGADPTRRPSTDALVAALVAQAAGVPWPDGSVGPLLRDDAVTQLVPDEGAGAGPVPGLHGAAAGPARDGHTSVLPVGPAAATGGPVPGGAPQVPAPPGAGEPVDAPDPDLPAAPGSGYVRPPAPRRWGSIAALGLVTALAGAQFPVVTLAVVVVLLVLARAVGSDVEAMHTRRERQGVRRADPARAVAAGPWHLLLGLLGLLPAAIVAGSVVVIAGGTGWWLVGTGRWHLTDAAAGEPPTGTAFAAATGLLVLAGAVLLWTGPLAELTRIGTRRVLGVLAPGRAGALVLVVVALAAGAILLTRVLDGTAVSWWPMPDLVLPTP